MSKFHAIYGKGGVSPEPGGNTYGEVQTLLWTNSTPTTNFSAKTVQLDLSNYDGVIVEFASTVRETIGGFSSRIKVAKNVSGAIGGGFTTETFGVARTVTSVTNSGVVFNDAHASNTDNSYMIPIHIYGYRRYEKETLTSSITNPKTGTANTDTNIGKGNYAMICRYSTDAKAPVFNKGTIVSYLYSALSEGKFSQAILVKANDEGIINCPITYAYQIVTVG